MTIYFQRTCGQCPPCYEAPPYDPNAPPHPFNADFYVSKNALVYAWGFPEYTDFNSTKAYLQEIVEYRKRPTNQLYHKTTYVIDPEGNGLPVFTPSGIYSLWPDYERYMCYWPGTRSGVPEVPHMYPGTSALLYQSPDYYDGFYDGAGNLIDPPDGTLCRRLGSLIVEYTRPDLRNRISRILADSPLKNATNAFWNYSAHWQTFDPAGVERFPYPPQPSTRAAAWYCEGGPFKAYANYSVYAPAQRAPFGAEVVHAYHWHGYGPTLDFPYYYHTWGLPENALPWDYFGALGDIKKLGTYQSTSVLMPGQAIYLMPRTNSYIVQSRYADPTR